MWDVDAIGGSGSSIQPHSSYRAHNGGIEDVTWNHCNAKIFGAVGDDGFISLWDIRNGMEVLAHNFNMGEVNGMAFSPHNEELLSVGYFDGTLAIIDLRQMSTPLLSFKGHYGAIRQVNFSPHLDNILASGSEDGAICIWNLSCLSFTEFGRNYRPYELKFFHRSNFSSVNDLAWNLSDPCVLMNVNNDENCIWQPSDNFLQ